MPVLKSSVLDQFAADGYVASGSLLTADEIDAFAPADRPCRGTTNRRRNSQHLADKSEYEQSFVQCMRLWETDPEVAPLTFHPVLAQAAAELLGVDRVRLWQDQALYKEPGGRITDAHQDAPFWPIGDAPLVSAWIPLDGSTRENGALGYVPGSHTLGALKMVNLLQTTKAYDILSDPALGGQELVYVEAAKGTVVWHHGMTVHAALPNTTDYHSPGLHRRVHRRRVSPSEVVEELPARPGWCRCRPARCKETACPSRGLVHQATFPIPQPRSANGQDRR